MATSPDSVPASLSDATAANAAVVVRLWDEAFNQGALAVLEELVHPEFTNFGQPTNGPQFLARLISAQRAAFPDMRFTILQAVADGDWIFTRARWAGTFVGPFPWLGLDGVEPTGRRFDVDHVHGFRFQDAKIAEHWAVRDDLTMHMQLLGNIPA